MITTCDSHANLVRKAASVIGTKSHHLVSERAAVYTEPWFTNKLGNIALIVADESHSIMNAK